MALIRTNYPGMSSLLDDFFGTDLADWRSQNYSSTNTTLPKVNIKENENGFIVEMAAPGMKKEDFNIQLDQNLLTISSKKEEKKEEHNEEKDSARYTRREFAYQAFTRSFSLPESAAADKISASYEDGILTISIPKKEEAKPQSPRSIEIS